MPSLTLTVTAQVATRIQNAYGATSLAELKTMIITEIKNKVASYETSLVEQAEQIKREAADQARITAIQTAQTTADSEIILT